MSLHLDNVSISSYIYQYSIISVCFVVLCYTNLFCRSYHIVHNILSKISIFQFYIDPELEEDENMRRFWCALQKENLFGTSFFIKAQKQFKHHRLGAGRDIYRSSFDRGMNFLSSQSRHYFMCVIESMRYTTGNVYSWRMFVVDISDELKFGVNVTILEHLNGEPS